MFIVLIYVDLWLIQWQICLGLGFVLIFAKQLSAMNDITKTQLNLPNYKHRLSLNGSSVQIFDPIRRKFVPLTPEEWVRQHFVNYMIEFLGVPAGLIVVESALCINGVNHRADIVVYSRNAEPLMVVECKSTDIQLTSDVVGQVCRYNLKYNAPYMLVTNGLQHICVHRKSANTGFEVVQIPTYSQM